MASNEPNSPRASKRQRKSLPGLFEDMDIQSQHDSSSECKERGTSRPSIATSSGSTAKPGVGSSSSLRGTFRHGWPPSMRERLGTMAGGNSQPATLTMRMSDLYRVYGDGWQFKPPGTADDAAKPADEFAFVTKIMGGIQGMVASSPERGADAASDLFKPWLRRFTGRIKRLGRDLDSTRPSRCAWQSPKASQVSSNYSDCPKEYQARLEQLEQQQPEPGERHVIRTRREVVQHAAAFQHLINRFVNDECDMTQELICETHAILVSGCGGESAGILSGKEHGGVYRTVDVYVGAHRFPRPARIREDMRSFVGTLAADIETARRTGFLDPFALAAKHCDRFVNIHPFRDGNGRMCRLILNAILVRFAGIVVNVGEHDQSRDEYIGTARESREVGGHPGALATLVLREASKTYRKLRNSIKGTFQGGGGNDKGKGRAE